MSFSTTTSCQGAVGDALELAGKQLEATDELEELLFQRSFLVHAERQRMIGPGAMDIHRDLRVDASSNLVEQNGWRGIANLRQGGARGHEVRLEFDLVFDAKKLALLPPARREILESPCSIS